MPVTYCRKCGKKIKAPESSIGKRGQCPACGEWLVVAATDEEPPKLILMEDAEPPGVKVQAQVTLPVALEHSPAPGSGPAGDVQGVETKESFFSKVKVSAELAKKQAILKQKEVAGLSEVYTRAGEYGYAKALGKDVFRQQYAVIEDLDRQVAELKRPKALDEKASIGGKAKHVVSVARDMVVLEALSSKRKGALRDLGKALCGSNIEDTEISKHRQSESKYRAELEALRGEITALQGRASGIGKRPFLVIGAALAVTTLVAWLWPRKTETSDWQATIDRMNSSYSDTLERKAEVDLQMATERLAAEQARREAEARDDSAPAEALERQSYMEQQFTKLDLAPRLTCSPEIQKHLKGVELRGDNIEAILRAFHAKDWLGLYNAVTRSALTEPPSRTDVNGAVLGLANRRLKVLVKGIAGGRDTDLDAGERSSGSHRQWAGGERPLDQGGAQVSKPAPEPLWITIRCRPTIFSIHASTSFERHQDGIGALHTWEIKEGPVYLTYGDCDEEKKALEGILKPFNSKVEYLGKKARLGEIDRKSREAELAGLAEDLRRAVASYIENDSDRTRMHEPDVNRK